MMRNIAIAVLLAFAVTLAVVIGNRMSAEAMAVVVGVVCGVAAGIPMSVLLMIILSRTTHRNDEAAAYGPQGLRAGTYPPVVVIQGGTPAPSAFLPPYYAAPPLTQEPTQRSFRIVGEQED